MLNMSITGRLYFNSRPSARGDGIRLQRFAKPFYFNSRPSARGDNSGTPAGGLNLDFNSRPSARGDFANTGAVADSVFQFTPLREGRRDAVLHLLL